MTKYDNDVLSRDGWCGPTPPSPYKWFSKWSPMPGQSGLEVQRTMADTIAILQIHSEKFNICSCQGIVKRRPHKICWMIFSYFWHFMWVGLARRSVASPPHVLFPYNHWLAVTYTRMSLCVCGTNIFWSIRNIFCSDLKIFFWGEIIQNRGHH